MAASAHAYVRGNTLQFYEWLKKHSARSIPQGPPIWICGDCHVGNIGPLADAEGRIEIQIRDLDQTVIGNPAHDLIRLALSLATAARGSDLPGVTVVKMMEEMINGYEEALRTPKRRVAADKDDLAPIRVVLEQARKRRWHHLAEERIEDVRPEIPLGKRFWTLKQQERSGIEKLFGREDVVAKILGFKGRKAETKISVVDAAYWMKGCQLIGAPSLCCSAGDRREGRSQLLPDRLEGGNTGRGASQQAGDAQQCAESGDRCLRTISQPWRADVSRRAGRQGFGHAGTHAAGPQIRSGSSHSGRGSRSRALPRWSGRKGARSTAGHEKESTVAGKIEAATLEKSRCAKLAVVQCSRPHR